MDFPFSSEAGAQVLADADMPLYRTLVLAVLLACASASHVAVQISPIGAVPIKGAVVLSSDDISTSMTLQWHLEGVEPDQTAQSGESNSLGVHVHSGKDCSSSAGQGGHFYNTASDPWGDKFYTSDASGNSQGSLTIDAGTTIKEVTGKVFVVHNAAGGRVACGVIGDAERANLAPLSGGSQAGQVVVTDADDALEVYYFLSGLEPSQTAQTAQANSLGVHVHSGTACTDSAAQGGHFYGGSVTSDPWGPVHYTSTAAGAAVGMVSVISGYSAKEQNGKAFLVHAADGSRVACGVLARGAQQGKCGCRENCCRECALAQFCVAFVLVYVPCGVQCSDGTSLPAD